MLPHLLAFLAGLLGLSGLFGLLSRASPAARLPVAAGWTAGYRAVVVFPVSWLLGPIPQPWALAGAVAGASWGLWKLTRSDER